MVNAYRDELTRQLLTREAERVALVEALLEGRVVEEAGLWEIATMLRLPVRGPYVVVAAECPAIGKSALSGIEGKLSSLDIASAWRLLPDIQIGLVHIRSDAKFDTLQQAMARHAVTRIGISSRFDDLSRTPEAVTYARIALSAERVDGSLVGVFEADPLAIAAVSAPEVMKQISGAIFAGLADLDDEGRELLFKTFRTWVSVGGSINVAAEQLYCHPNTVRHRLHRIEERTGRSIGHPRELAELCLAFEVDLRVR
jgi:DNA-binding PucR family transcriptional regulator